VPAYCDIFVSPDIKNMMAKKKRPVGAAKVCNVIMINLQI
jgi:hypothetical protein